MRPVPLALASFFATTALCVGTAAAQSTPLVYVRCARTDVTVDLTLDVTIDGTTRAVTRTMRGSTSTTCSPTSPTSSAASTRPAI